MTTTHEGARKMDFTAHTPAGTRSKIDRYGWIVKDTPGVMMLIDKRELRVNHEYQRQLNPSKITEMSGRWSWIACGAITVGMRDGIAWVIDGQHRVAAAMRRADITNLPCIVFDLENIQDEAKGFLSSNKLRRPMSAVDHFRAEVVAGNAAAIQFAELCAELNLNITTTGQSAGTIKAAKWGMDRMAESPTDARLVLSLVADIATADNMQVPERLLEGLWYIHQNCETNLTDPRLRERIKKVGARALIRAALEAAQYYARGGARVWASGMMNLINKGMRNRFRMQGIEE